MNQCPVCQEYFEETDQVFENEDNLYHRDCLDLIPTTYDVFTTDGQLIKKSVDPEFNCAHEYF